MKQTRNSLLTSVIAFVLCLTMLLGTTFAWFTDIVSSSGNVIQSGNLDVQMFWSDDLATWNDAEGAKVFDYDKWEPGYTEVKYIKVYNNGNLNLKWTLSIEANGRVSNLAEVIDVYYVNPVSEKLTSLDGLDSAGKLSLVLENNIPTSGNGLEPGQSAVFAIALHMDELAGNDYQNKSLCDGGFSLKLLATQEIGESDSFGPDYDADARWPNGEMSFEVSANLDQVQTVYGELANNLIVRYSDSVYALLSAGTKLADGVSSLKFSGKAVENGSNITLGDGDTAQSYDIHIEGIADDNKKPITVYLGKIFEAGISETSLKLYHEDELMTRVNSVADFEINNQYTYDYNTGEVVLFVDNFSVFSGVTTSADVWDCTSADGFASGSGTEEDPYIIESAEQLAYFRDLVDGGNTFAGKTVKLAADIDLDNKSFDPIGFGYNIVFSGTFDGGNHTIYNLYQNGWELGYSYGTQGGGLFASVKNATIKNLAISGAEIVMECVDMGTVVGYAQGTCHFENIVVTNTKLANYQRYTGGVVGEVGGGEYGTDVSNGYSHTFKNITVDSSVKISSLWGDFDNACGGVIGGKWGDATVKMENVIVACEIDAFSDVTAAYQWYAYRRCGMLIGHTEQNSPKQALNAAASFLTCENVKVYYGDWVNYNYYQFADQDNATGQRYPWVRAEAGEHNAAFSNPRYGVPTYDGEKVTDGSKATASTPITFNQLYGGGQGVYGCNEHDGVTVTNKLTKTVYIQNNLGWENLKLHYWFANGENRWTTLIDGVDMSTMLLENGVYKVEIPIFANGFKISADGDNVTDEFLVINVANNGFYLLEGEHEHDFNASGNCICGCKKVIVNIAEYAGANGWNNGTKYSSIVANDDIAITCTGGAYTGSFYEGNNWRIYQSDAGKVTITSANGNILSVKVTYEIDKTGILTLNGTNIASGTIVNVNDTSVTFGVGNTSIATNGQARITDIEVIYSTVLACAHTQTTTETKAPTCTEAGYTATKCIECGKVMSKVEGDPAIKHSYSGEITTEATCTEKGLKTYTCANCQSSYTENISAKGHSYNDGVVTTEATCTEKGEKTLTCSICSDTKTEIIDDLGHDYVDGVCSRCNDELADEEIWKLVTDASNLEAGDQIIIVAKNSKCALSTTQNGNNRGQATVTNVDDTVTFGDDVQIITLEAGKADGTFAFNTDSGYLYAASSSSNYLRTESTLSNNSSWAITISADGTATIKAQGANTRNWLRYNTTSSIFSCYGSGQADVAIYKLVGGSDSGNEGGTTEPETPTESTVVLEITKDDFNSTSYVANNNTKTENGYSYTSNQVMNQSSTMQWQKSTGYITIASNSFVKLEMKSTAGTYTVTVGGKTVTGTITNGVTTYDLTGLTGEIKISVGSATGKVDYIKFYK